MANSPLPIRRIHHVELYAGNAKQAAFYYRKGFGFSQSGYCGPETGHRDRASYFLTQNRINLIITGAMVPENPVADFLKAHGDGVRDIAFECDDVDAVFAEAVKRGAKPVHGPEDRADANGRIRIAAIHTYGDTIHSFLSKQDYNGPLLPGFETREIAETDCGLEFVDHIVGNVEDHKMVEWKQWYETIFGFSQFVSFDDKDISTEFSALRSVVMTSPNKAIKFPINEPAEGKKKSQIQEYIEFNRAPGVQHLALITGDACKTIADLRARGIDFLPIPDSYYETVMERVAPIDEDIADLKQLGILIDRDESGYLLQLFTRPVQDRPTLFIEIIQRKGCQSFGKGNFKALFESIEREQARRGNL
ncbi:MAG: 4-hydroxyphenylpyruvate dioxygenase [Planctomycetota bacterium]